MREKWKPVLRTILMVLPLLAGEWIYLHGRKSNTVFEAWLHIQKNAVSTSWSNWLPDYFWCVSLLAAMVLLWKGWSRIPLVWRTGLWVLITGSELLQHLHILPGTGDMTDILIYQAAFVSVYALHKTNTI
jgi:hypothetical protein